jgi:hypothetical protein
MKKFIKALFGKKEKPMQYWHLRGVHTDSYGVCSDNYCPCPQVTIPRGEGYIYIVKHENGRFSANITCEIGARKRNLNLKIAHNDAKFWWETGLVPFRETPTYKGFQEAPYISSISEKEQENIRKKQKEETLRRLDAIIGDKENEND